MSAIEKQIDDLNGIVEELESDIREMQWDYSDADHDLMINVRKDWVNKIRSAIDTIKKLSAQQQTAKLAETEKRCETCNWFIHEGSVDGYVGCICTNNRSDFYTDSVDEAFKCEKWEARMDATNEQT